ncbi:SAM-dependent methyltransferase [Paractinoplanes aksuensis]|uniref:SAM-dependent methyltransferase n=1 Tax=Paractinoplanes aksuensis TaxID=2939490 RepID=UPI002112989B|nr:SAM-dependent methyltransferase [Actinoplanes aksuensis]
MRQVVLSPRSPLTRAVALSHLAGDFAPESWAAVTEIYRRQGMTMRVRSRAEIEGFFDGLELVDPGLQVLTRWRPQTGESGAEPDAAVSVYAGWPAFDDQLSRVLALPVSSSDVGRSPCRDVTTLGSCQRGADAAVMA